MAIEQPEPHDPDRATPVPEILSATLAHQVQTGAMERWLAEAEDAALRAEAQPDVEENALPRAETQTAGRHYRAFRLGLPEELRTVGGFYLIMGDLALEVTPLSPLSRPPASRARRLVWVLGIARLITIRLIQFTSEFWSVE